MSINIKKNLGPYGGGNQFANGLEGALVAAGHEVLRTLAPELDLILIVNAQSNLLSTAYTVEQIERYVFHHPSTVVVHRVNTCDEQRGRLIGINNAVLAANRIADHTVFVSDWVRGHFIERGMRDDGPHTVILNGADREIFHADGRAEWTPGEPIKLVTHHWSDNYLKGFDIYERIDNLLDRPEFRERFSMTFIGNVNIATRFRNVEVVEPIAGPTLAAALREHHLYVTGTRLEPGGNHYVEAMACGLPVLHLESGSTPEYCAEYGVGFRLDNFEEKLDEAAARLTELREKVLTYDDDATKMTAQYTALFDDIMAAPSRREKSAPGAIRRVTFDLAYLGRHFGRLGARVWRKVHMG
ncbi:MAG: glycosyltransferase [Deltaproteobacteria bacterium]|nr:glycosyltransferase [Deltaproteobacteria bacterium]MCB9479177.1 glycosyltransferase [Deltaproteobacteria bacterium]MCB9489152.1 glycosyltransferase [Deltaproteobacteria bacterium]